MGWGVRGGAGSGTWWQLAQSTTVGRMALRVVAEARARDLTGRGLSRAHPESSGQRSAGPPRRAARDRRPSPALASPRSSAGSAASASVSIVPDTGRRRQG